MSGVDVHAGVNYLTFNFDMEGFQLKTTVRIGIASYPKHALTLEALMEKADRALYESKEAGRNKVSINATQEIKIDPKN